MKDHPNVDYIPIDRNHVAIQCGSTTRRDTFTPQDYDRAIEFIKLALDEHPIVLPEFKHVNKLYPIEAATILQLSRTRHWPGYEPDAVLEACLMSWFKNSVDDPNDYTTLLFKVLVEMDCIDGVYLRLNFDTLAQPEMSSIRITTPAGSTTHRTEPRKYVLMGAARKRVREMLKRQHKYTSTMGVLYNSLQRMHQTYDLEQSLLSWMGYLIIRSVAENSQPIIIENRLLIEQPRTETLPPTPNSPKLEK